MFSMWDMDFVTIKLHFGSHYPSPQYPQSYQFKLNNVNLEFIVEPDNYAPDPKVPSYMQPKLELMWIDLDKDDYPKEHWNELAAAMEKFIRAFKLPPMIEGLTDLYIDYMERKRRRKIEEDLYLCEREFKLMKAKATLKIAERERMEELKTKIPKLRAGINTKHFSTLIHRMFLGFLLRVPFRHTKYRFLNYVTYYSYAAKYRQLAAIEIPPPVVEPQELGYEQLLHKFKLQQIEVSLLEKRAKLKLMLIPNWGSRVYKRIHLRRFSQIVSNTFRTLMKTAQLKGKADVYPKPTSDSDSYSNEANKIILNKLEELLADLNSTEPTVPIKALEMANSHEVQIAALTDEIDILKLDLPNRISTEVKKMVSTELTGMKAEISELVEKNKQKEKEIEVLVSKGKKIRDEYERKVSSMEDKSRHIDEMYKTTVAVAKESTVLYNDVHKKIDTLDNFDRTYSEKVRVLEGKLEDLPKFNMEQYYEVVNMVNKTKEMLQSAEVYQLRENLRVAEYRTKQIDRDFPKIVASMAEVQLGISQYQEALKKGKEMIDKLKGATQETHKGIVAAQHDLMLQSKLETKQERMRKYRERKAESKKLTFTPQQQKTVNSELTQSRGKIVEFCSGWGTLAPGDFYCYRDELIPITEEFNPSVRIKHTGQNGDPWEIQKHANAKWYHMGYVGFQNI